MLSLIVVMEPYSILEALSEEKSAVQSYSLASNLFPNDGPVLKSIVSSRREPVAGDLYGIESDKGPRSAPGMVTDLEAKTQTSGR